MSIGLKKVIKLFERGNVFVCGLRGRGKDMLFANVIVRRKIQYCSNVDYSQGEKFIPYDYSLISCGENTYKSLTSNKIVPFTCGLEDHTDVYISDAGIYFPAQYCNELNRDYKGLPLFMALSRHLCLGNVHINVQNYNRCWDKIREQCDQYILCRKCIVIKNVVIQLVTIYDKPESLMNRLPPYPIKPKLNDPKDVRAQKDLARIMYRCTNGTIKNKLLIYKNKSKYDTRIFKKILAGEKYEKGAKIDSCDDNAGGDPVCADASGACNSI